MFRYILIFFICLPFLSVAFHKFYVPYEYQVFAINNKINPSRSNSDNLPLKKEDLIESGDKGWYPDFNADPNDYIEEIDLPKHSEAMDEKKTT